MSERTRVFDDFSFFLTVRAPPYSTLFPDTTLFRSPSARAHSGRSARPGHCHISAAIPPGRSTRATSSPASGNQCHASPTRSEEHTSELQSRQYIVCRLLLEKKHQNHTPLYYIHASL